MRANDRVSTTTLMLRAPWGAALVTGPRILLEKVGKPPQPAQPPAAARVVGALGARHLLQCIFELVGGDRAVRFGVAVDLLHAASDIGFASVDRHWRRAAITDAVVTLGFVGLGIAGTAAPRSPEFDC